MKPNTLIIAATHGNEQLGVIAAKNLEPKYSFDWIIGNERAFQRGTRYTEADLNRSAPGDPDSPVYESRRAAELVALAKDYDFTIDIHGTDADCGIFVIITNPTPENIALAEALPIERCVYWPAISKELTGPLSEYFPCGLEIECGKKTEPETLANLMTILEKTIPILANETPASLLQKTSVTTKQWYIVEDALASNNVATGVLQDFVETTVNGKIFTPLLSDVYREAYGFACMTLSPWSPTI